jgi:hypothetical protein
MRRHTFQLQGFNDIYHTIAYRDNNRQNERKKAKSNPNILDFKHYTMSLCQNLINDEKTNFYCNFTYWIQTYLCDDIRLSLGLAYYFPGPQHHNKHQL